MRCMDLFVAVSLVASVAAPSVAADTAAGRQVSLVAGPLTQAALHRASEEAPVAESAAATRQGTGPQLRRISSMWASVRELAPHTQVVVIVEGPEANGFFVSADDSELVVADDAGRVTHLARERVISVTAVRPDKYQRRAAGAVGSYVGGFGVPIAYVVLCNNDVLHCSDDGLGQLLIASLVGAVTVGLLFRHFAHPVSREVVYVRPQRPGGVVTGWRP